MKGLFKVIIKIIKKKSRKNSTNLKDKIKRGLDNWRRITDSRHPSEWLDYRPLMTTKWHDGTRNWGRSRWWNHSHAPPCIRLIRTWRYARGSATHANCGLSCSSPHNHSLDTACRLYPFCRTVFPAWTPSKRWHDMIFPQWYLMVHP